MSFKRFSIRNLKLATKTSIIIGAILLVLLSTLIGFSTARVGMALTRAIDGEFSGIASKNGIVIQTIIDTAANAAKDMQNYLLNTYSVGSNLTDEQRAIKKTSKVFSVQLAEINYEVENYILNTAWSLLQNNSDIIGIGAAFEPDAFDEAIREYSVYINTDEAKTRSFSNLGSYSEYSKEDYYSLSKNSRQASITKPYMFRGVLMSTISYPIIYNDVFQGVFLADISISNFGKIQTTDEKYPTMFVDIYTSDFTIAYDSESLDYVGTSFASLISSSEYNRIVEQTKNGRPFSIETLKDTGEKVCRYFYPIECGSEIWWGSSVLEKSDLTKDVRNIILLMVILSIAALIVIISMTTFILKKMLKPIDNVVSAALSIAQGDLNISIVASSGDEIGILSNSFMDMINVLKLIIQDVSYCLGKMADGNFNIKSKNRDGYVGDYQQILVSLQNINTKLSDTLSEINQSSDQVSSGSHQVSAGAQALSQGATEQASSVEELAATISEISQQITQTSQHTKEASQKVSIVGAEATDSNKRMQEMLHAMDEINKSSGEIGKIIKTIEDIAFQTNILALNAAVEAARAGASGKGFAVVADEVRNLASKSAQASKITAELIESSLKTVKNGIRIADETAQSLNNVVVGVQDVTNTIDKISEAAIEQANAITQVTTGVDQISSVVQTNSATAQQSAATSEELSGQASMLKSLVERFEFKQEAPTITISNFRI